MVPDDDVQYSSTKKVKRETLEKKKARVLQDKVELVPYDLVWPILFE